jgi:alpha-glucosidase
MKNKLTGPIAVLLLSSIIINAQKSKTFEIKSLNGNIDLKVEVGAKLQWSVQHNGQQIIAPSSISLQIRGDEILGDNAKIKSTNSEKITSQIQAINYKKAIIPDEYSQLTINCKGDYGLIFRVYNDGVAYRFYTKKKGEIVVENEEANFNFTEY